MRLPRLFTISLTAMAVLRLPVNAADAPSEIPTIHLESTSPGRIFEGIGALSAGASSRLLIEYPEPQRSQVLDYLFKPNYGASLQHLKVEIGGDVNSTDGTEPSYARTRQEYTNPKPEYFQRGYEWWLMEEAKKRNPGVVLDILQWGAPGWIGDQQTPQNLDQVPFKERIQPNRNKFYSQDNADYIAGFIQGAKKYHGVNIDYCGIWNEMRCDYPWVKLLRKTLDKSGLQNTKIIAADQTGSWVWVWDVAKEMLKDKELINSINSIGAHYPGMQNHKEGDHRYDSQPAARETGKPLSSSEDGPWKGDWDGARDLAKMFNRNYIRGKMTRTVIWSLVSSYYDNLPIANSGPMKALTPWSGHFEIQPALWAIAHTTQFAQPGWKYLDSGCALLKDGSYVTLKSPNGSDFSVIIETVDANEPQTLEFRTAGGLSQKPLHVWHSTEASQFNHEDDLTAAVNGVHTIKLQPGSIYSVTTTTGQAKGNAAPPADGPFPFPYTDNFDKSRPGSQPRYFADQGGIFEVAKRPNGEGNFVRQTVDRRGIDWNGHPNPEPYTMLGSTKWRNYEVACDASVDIAGHISLFGRITKSPQSDEPPRGYWLKLSTDSSWELKAFTKTLQTGSASFEAGRTHHIALRFTGSHISGFVDGKEVVSVEDQTFGGGMAGFGSGWNLASFDNFSVAPVNTPGWVNLAAGCTATASSSYGPNYEAKNATDEDVNTRWNAAEGKSAGEWLEVNLGKSVEFNKLIVRQYEPRIKAYKVQYLAGAEWREAFIGDNKGEETWTAKFPSAKSNRVRLLIVSCFRMPSIYEMEVYSDPTQ